MNNTDSNLAPAARAFAERYDIQPAAEVNLPEVAEGEHQHVAINWAGGTVWLDMSDLYDHFCIDVTQFRGDVEDVPTGVFSIQAGRRITLDVSDIPEDERMSAHGWPACPMPILITEKS